MDNRQCMGLDKFHQCLSTIFPSNDEVEQGDLVDSSANRIPVQFTKNAVELLRETLTVFLRKVGKEIVEELEEGDQLSQQPIRPEDVVRVLLAFDEDSADDEKTMEIHPNHFPQMKEIVKQAQGLLLERTRLENQDSERATKRNIKQVNNDDPENCISMKPAQIDSKESYATAAATADTNTTKEPPKKKRGKRKKPKIKITAEMEAEQERLLNASKKALESSQQQQGDGASFRVQLS